MFLESRCNFFRQLAVSSLAREDNGPARTCDQFGLHIAQFGVTPHDVEPIATLYRKHHCQRLVRPELALPQGGDGRHTACIAHQVIAADTLDGDDLSLAKECQRGVKRGAFLRAHVLSRVRELDHRSAGRTGDGFSMESSVCRVAVFCVAFRTEREIRHARVRPVVGKFANQRVTWATLGAVDERVSVTAVLRIAQFCVAVIAHEIIGRHKNPGIRFRRTLGN